MTRCKIFILIFLFSKAGFAQTTTNGWLAMFSSYKLDKKFSIHLDVQARSTDKLEHLNAFLFRPGLNWHFRKNMIATAGYALNYNRRSALGVAGYVSEHRIWEQLIFNQRASFVTIQHRLRLEQRFLGTFRVVNGDFIKGGNRFANRLRYFTRAILPFNGSNPFVQGIYGAIQDEIFVNIGDKSAVNGKFFDQNRLYLSAGYRLSSKIDVEAGYLNQYVYGANKSVLLGHIVQLATYLRL